MGKKRKNLENTFLFILKWWYEMLFAVFVLLLFCFCCSTILTFIFNIALPPLTNCKTISFQSVFASILLIGAIIFSSYKSIKADILYFRTELSQFIPDEKNGKLIAIINELVFTSMFILFVCYIFYWAVFSMK